MLDSIFRGVFETGLTAVIAPSTFLLCIGVSLLLGLQLCAMTMWRAKSSGSFAATLALLPAVVCVVIMMVNGNVGAGVAVAGAFSLVRFRSAREIGAIFIAMASGGRTPSPLTATAPSPTTAAVSPPTTAPSPAPAAWAVAALAWLVRSPLAQKKQAAGCRGTPVSKGQCRALPRKAIKRTHSPAKCPYPFLGTWYRMLTKMKKWRG